MCVCVFVCVCVCVCVGGCPQISQAIHKQPIKAPVFFSSAFMQNSGVGNEAGRAGPIDFVTLSHAAVCFSVTGEKKAL